jgi:hypothetical protein
MSVLDIHSSPSQQFPTELKIVLQVAPKVRQMPEGI